MEIHAPYVVKVSVSVPGLEEGGGISISPGIDLELY